MNIIKQLPQIDGDLGWYLTAPNIEENIGVQLKGEQVADIVVIGAGYTGLSTAHRLKELYPNKVIAVVEALKVGQGTSGRNAGFIIDLPHNLDANEGSLEDDAQLYALNCFSINRLDSMRKEFNIECLWHKAGKYMVAAEDKNRGGLDDFEKVLKKNNFEYQRYNQTELQNLLGTSYYKDGIYTPGNILMNPSALIRGVGIGLAKQGIKIYEDSPVIRIEYGKENKIYTVGGVIKAKTLVQTINSFTEEFGLLKNKLAPVFTYGSLTDPIPQDIYDDHFADIEPWGLTSAHPAGTTARLTPDRRILIRNILDFNSSLNSTAQQRDFAWKQHRKSFIARFPFLKEIDFQYTWGGMLCMTLNHNSVFERVKDNVYMVCGCNGVGVAKGTYLGYYMAEMIYGNESKELDFIKKSSNVSWVPPEPLRSIGAKYKIKKEEVAAGKDI